MNDGGGPRDRPPVFPVRPLERRAALHASQRRAGKTSATQNHSIYIYMIGIIDFPRL